MGEIITLTTADGIQVSAYKAMPVGTPKGGIVVVQEIFGVNHHIRSVADKFAAAGYVAVAPALFDRVEKSVELPYDEAGMKHGIDLAMKSPAPEALKDISAAAAVAAEGGKVGVVGFCWGGTLAYASAAYLGDTISAAVGYYGGFIAKNLAPAIKAPLILHFGEKDDHIPMSDVDLISKTHPDIPVYIYDAGHGFNCDERGSYDETAAGLAMSRTMAFFAEHVG